MAAGYPGATPGMGQQNDSSLYAFEGYPVEEVRQRYCRVAYRLQDYEQKACDEIRQMLERGRFRNPDVIEENILFLQSLVKKLTLVLSSEQNEGILNSELRTRIEEIKALYSRLMAQLEFEEKAKA